MISRDVDAGADSFMEAPSEIRKIALLGDYAPRKFCRAVFTSHVLSALAAEHPKIQCFAVPVNDPKGRRQYPKAATFASDQDSRSFRSCGLATQTGLGSSFDWLRLPGVGKLELRSDELNRAKAEWEEFSGLDKPVHYPAGT